MELVELFLKELLYGPMDPRLFGFSDSGSCGFVGVYSLKPTSLTKGKACQRQCGRLCTLIDSRPG